MKIQQLGWELPATQFSWIAAFLSVMNVRRLFIIHTEQVLKSILYFHINAIWWVQSCQPYPISGEDLSSRWSSCLNLAQRFQITSVLFSAAQKKFWAGWTAPCSAWWLLWIPFSSECRSQSTEVTKLARYALSQTAIIQKGVKSMCIFMSLLLLHSLWK